MRALSVVLVLAVSVLVGPAPSASARTPSGFQKGIHAITNEIRVAEDLEKLKKQRCVQKFAKKQARRMARQKRMYHQDLGPILQKCDLTSVGENVAYGFTSPEGVMDAWMDSPGHRANILGEGYRLLGVGAKQSDEGRWYLAQVFGRK